MKTEPILALEFVYGLLAANSELLALAPGGLWSELADQSAGYPRIIVQSQGGGIDLKSDDGSRQVWSEPIIVVKAVDRKSTYQRIDPIATEIYNTLEGTQGQTSDGVVVACVRELAFGQPEAEGATQWRTLLQQFRVFAYATE